MNEQLPVHSPLGASSAERWINCPGSVALIKALGMKEETDEPDYRANGIAAHEAAAKCLAHSLDAWEVVGEKFHTVEIDAEIGDAVQLYLDTVRPHIANTCEDRQVFIEHRISSPIHPLFYGTVDLAVIENGSDHVGQEVLDLTDYKHGEGIMVDVEENPQLMYYAFGMLQDFPEIDKVRLRIVQPRGFHEDGPVREWVTTAAHIKQWAEEVLVPAMLRTELEHDLDPGPHCRFCPAKLVHKKANRVFKDGAATMFKQVYGDKAFTPPELKGPAAMEKIDAGAKELVKEWAYTPQSGLTIALESDPRIGVKVESSASTFGAAVAASADGLDLPAFLDASQREKA